MIAWSVCAVDGFGRVLELCEWVRGTVVYLGRWDREKLLIEISSNR